MLSRYLNTTLRAFAAIAALCSAAAFAQSGKTELLWLGQATTRVTTPGGKVIVIDPWLTSNPKTPANFKDLSALGTAPGTARMLVVDPGQKVEF